MRFPHLVTHRRVSSVAPLTPPEQAGSRRRSPTPDSLLRVKRQLSRCRFATLDCDRLQRLPDPHSSVPTPPRRQFVSPSQGERTADEARTRRAWLPPSVMDDGRLVGGVGADDLPVGDRQDAAAQGTVGRHVDGAGAWECARRPSGWTFCAGPPSCHWASRKATSRGQINAARGKAGRQGKAAHFGPLYWRLLRLLVQQIPRHLGAIDRLG